jgi:hypothetical protein
MASEISHNPTNTMIASMTFWGNITTSPLASVQFHHDARP